MPNCVGLGRYSATFYTGDHTELAQGVGDLQGLTDVSYYWLSHTLATGGQPQEALNQLAKLSDRFPSSPVLAQRTD